MYWSNPLTFSLYGLVVSQVGRVAGRLGGGGAACLIGCLHMCTLLLWGGEGGECSCRLGYFTTLLPAWLLLYCPPQLDYLATRPLLSTGHTLLTSASD